MPLYIVSTPIGNLKDITFRAVEVLKSVDTIACEDTRTTKKLTDTYEIRTPLTSFHAHSTDGKLEFLLRELEEGKNIALVSDAGTPGISDPGYVLISKAAEKNIPIIPLPGASAFLTALQASGVSTHAFLYLGFLPIKKGRKTLLETFQNEERTIVFYESVHRIQKTISDLKTLLGAERRIVIARELTKLFEEIFRGTLEEAETHFKNPRGEFVVIIPAIE